MLFIQDDQFSMKFYRGKYKVKNPEKYRGDLSNVVHRSMWERQAFKYLGICIMACIGACGKFCKDRCGSLKNCLTKCCDDFITPKPEPEPVQAQSEN